MTGHRWQTIAWLSWFKKILATQKQKDTMTVFNVHQLIWNHLDWCLSIWVSFFYFFTNLYGCSIQKWNFICLTHLPTCPLKKSCRYIQCLWKSGPRCLTMTSRSGICPDLLIPIRWKIVPILYWWRSLYMQSEVWT